MISSSIFLCIQRECFGLWKSGKEVGGGDLRVRRVRQAGWAFMKVPSVLRFQLLKAL